MKKVVFTLLACAAMAVTFVGATQTAGPVVIERSIVDPISGI